MVANCDVIDRRTGQISNNRATYDLLTMKFTIKSDKGVEYSVIDPNDNPHHLFDIDFTTDLGMATFVGSNSVYAFNTGDFKNDPYVYCNFTAYYEYESYNFDFKFLIQVGA
jgi:hypothetical protein